MNSGGTGTRELWIKSANKYSQKQGLTGENKKVTVFLFHVFLFNEIPYFESIEYFVMIAFKQNI